VRWEGGHSHRKDHTVFAVAIGEGGRGEEKEPKVRQNQTLREKGPLYYSYDRGKRGRGSRETATAGEEVREEGGYFPSSFADLAKLWPYIGKKLQLRTEVRQEGGMFGGAKGMWAGMRGKKRSWVRPTSEKSLKLRKLGNSGQSGEKKKGGSEKRGRW